MNAISIDRRSTLTNAVKRLRSFAGLALVAAITMTTMAVASPASAETRIVTIQQMSSGRYVDAHEHAGEDFRIVTRTAQNNDTQLWRMTEISPNVYTFQQLSSGRYWDAHEYEGEDYRLVTRTAQNNNTQRWLVQNLGGNIYTIQQMSNGRYVDAHEHAGEDYRLVTRTAQNNATQQWRIVTVLVEADPAPPPPPAPVVHSSGNFQWGGPMTADFDNGNVAFFGGDLKLAAPDLVNLQFIPEGGAQISFTNGAQRGHAGCSAAAFSSNPVPLSAISAGDYVCVKTNQGRIAEFRVNSIGPLLSILSVSYTTWQ